MTDTVDTLPMSILSGNYQQNFYKGTPMSDVMGAYRERQPGRDVAAARQAVADRPEQDFQANRQDDIANRLKLAERELSDLEDQLRLVMIQGSSAATSRDTQVDRTPIQENVTP